MSNGAGMKNMKLFTKVQIEQFIGQMPDRFTAREFLVKFYPKDKQTSAYMFTMLGIAQEMGYQVYQPPGSKQVDIVIYKSESL